MRGGACCNFAKETGNVERLTALRGARTAWHELLPTNRVSPATETP